jgi:hypothetical protein
MQGYFESSHGWLLFLATSQTWPRKKNTQVMCKNYIGKELWQIELFKNIKKKPTNLAILLAWRKNL